MSNFTVKQLKAIEYMALGNVAQCDIALELGVRPQTVSKWKKKQGFMDAVLNRAKELLKHSIPDVYNVLADKSKLGNYQHIKILLDHLEKLEEVKSNTAHISFTWLPPTDTGDHDA